MDEVNYWHNQGATISSIGNCMYTSQCETFTHAAEAGCFPVYDYMIYSLIIGRSVSNQMNDKGPFLKTQWDQGIPFNNQLQPIDGQLPPLGCSAVAMGQIMAYHQWPSSYNWNEMLISDGYSITTQNFLKDIAIAINTNFAIDGSSAYITDVASKLKNTYGYSSTISVINHNDASVYAQLNLFQPVYMRGSMSNGDGHAWVCDGYRSLEYYTEYFLRLPVNYLEYGTGYSCQENYGVIQYYHMNWGWIFGLYNGWFFISDVNANQNNLDFRYNRQDIINIKK